MKRVISVLAIAVAALSFSACGNNPPSYSQGDTNSSEPKQ